MKKIEYEFRISLKKMTISRGHRNPALTFENLFDSVRYFKNPYKASNSNRLGNQQRFSRSVIIEKGFHAL